ncbi:MAG: helix-turn-helix transcriptional regulator [Thalassotalea sp.]
MFLLPFDTLVFYIIPLIAGQLLLLALGYAAFFRRQLVDEFPLHAVFVICFIIFLLGRGIQFYGGIIVAHKIMYLRTFIFLAIGIPSLLIANMRHCNLSMTPLSYIAPYVLGLLGASIWFIIRDGSSYQIFFGEAYGYILTLYISNATYDDVVIVMTLALIIIPNCYMLYRHHQKNVSQSTVLFLISTLLLGLVYIAGLYSQKYWLIYAGSVIIASSWCWAVYKDIKTMKVQANSLHDSIQKIIDNDDLAIQPEVAVLLNELDAEASNSLENYKFKVNKMLNLLTETTIAEGGDSEALLFRQSQKQDAIERSTNRKDVEKIATNEAIELSQRMTIIPTKKNKELVDKAILFIKINYFKELDLTELANQMEVSDSYLIRTFKKVMNETPNHYITNYRVQQAKLLLKNHSVQETSKAVGFNSSSYFGRVFKTQTGLSPMQFQKQLLSPNH